MLFQNVRLSANDLSGDLAILTSCWQEDPNGRLNFSQIIQMLLHYLSIISPEPVMPPKRTISDSVVLPPESPGTSTLMYARDDAGETLGAPKENRQEVSSSALTSFIDPSKTQFHFLTVSYMSF
ncbi:hypothetical protein V6N13_082458 [Hibiscus sabdariffa]